MKLPSLLLIGSLAVNVAALAFYISKFPSPTATSAPGPLAIGANQASPAGTAADKSAASAGGAADPLRQAWTELQSGDLKTLVAQLRAAGLPASLIRSIIAARVNEQFSARRKELLDEQGERPFWKTQNPYNDPKTQAALRALGKEQGELLKSLLGTDNLLANEEMRAFQRRQYGNLPAEKLAQLQVINSDYSELSQEIYAKANGLMLPEDRQKLAFLEKEKQADIAKTLTPQEFEEFQFRSSPTANQLRGKLANFEVNEAEFRAIYKLQAAFDAEYNPRGGPPSPEAMRNLGDAEKQLQAAILATLPPERAADYKLATDPSYQQVNRLVTRLELPPATTQQVISLQQDVQARANTLRADRALTPEVRNAQLAALQDEATAKLTTTLTPRGLEAYKQNGGYWIDSLKPRPGAPANGVVPALRRPGGD